jgi:hypothetical protein
MRTSLLEALPPLHVNQTVLRGDMGIDLRLRQPM